MTRLLAYMHSATAERIPELRQALRGSDSRVVAQAAQALARLGAPLTDGSLFSLLGDERRDVRHAFIAGLGQNADPRGVRHLTGVFEREDAQGRALVIQAVSRARTADGQKFLLEVIKDPESSDTERRLARSAVTPSQTL
jgi:HEAT repeat protein